MVRKFSIGVDLGTSNSVLAFTPLSGEGKTEALAIPQWETPSTVTESETLPSCLYLPEEAVAAEIGSADWIVGRLAQRKASETPGRVVKSAKSWLCHHTADRSAPFLPWGSDALAQKDKISPVAASAKILAHLRAAWYARFSSEGAGFEAQDITITVPASFDAAAQRLTLEAAKQAGFPDKVRLIEEPQAAFAWWLEQQDDPWRALPDAQAGARHVLVIDIGGGTTDFSLFEIARAVDGVPPAIKRVAVSDHILLGGDNIDLAIAHLLEPRLSRDGSRLSAGQWDHLVARCRSLKEKALGAEGAPDEVIPVSIPGRGSNLFAGALSAQVSRAELEELLLDGFFPDCRPTDMPRRALGAIKEFGLPYAFDGAITRHLAGFLRDRPGVDAVLFNGGSLQAARLRARLSDQIGRWQEGRAPQILENARLDLAVACGAASSGARRHRNAARIEAGAARAVFLEARRSAGRPLVCILPHGAPPGETFEVDDLDLSLRVNTPVRFQVFTSTRHEQTRAGDVVELDDGDFQALPPLETVAAVAQSPKGELLADIPVALDARVNDLGLLQVSCRSLAPEISQSWPLEFNLRPQARSVAAPNAPTSPDVAPAALAEARRRLTAAFTLPLGKRDKMTAPRVLQSLEQGLGRSKGEWSGALLRDLWTALEAIEATRATSVEHEEVWLNLAGYLLRPGFGAAGDDLRMDALWGICRGGHRVPNKRARLQENILWRRVAGGLSGERQESLLAAEDARLREPRNAPDELIRMTGAFERLDIDRKAELVSRFLAAVVELAAQKKHVAPYLAALAGLLSRTPFFAGPESVAPPSLVEDAYEALRKLDWRNPEFVEAQTLFLRAARAVDDRRLDLPKSLRNQIADKLQKAGAPAQKVERVRHFAPIERAERLSLYGEALPAGLSLGE